LLAVLAVAVGAAGCGSSSSRQVTQVTTSAAAPHSQAEENAAAKPRPSIAAEEAAPGDHSIQEYGAEAGNSEKEAVLAAMRFFFSAIATSDYARVCAGLAASNREQLDQLAKTLKHKAGKGCAATSAGLLNPAAAAEAKLAAAAAIGKVRIGQGTAFVLFRPPGGTLSYFAMKEEGGEWKAISLAPGTPLHP
jgi:hypothetical protein